MCRQQRSTPALVRHLVTIWTIDVIRDDARTGKEYLTAVSQEYDRLRDENPNESGDELLRKAFNIVENSTEESE